MFTPAMMHWRATYAVDVDGGGGDGGALGIVVAAAAESVENSMAVLVLALVLAVAAGHASHIAGHNVSSRAILPHASGCSGAIPQSSRSRTLPCAQAVGSYTVVVDVVMVVVVVAHMLRQILRSRSEPRAS